jgi:hypothetical protein
MGKTIAKEQTRAKGNGQKNDPRAIRATLARAVASRKVSDETIDAVAEQLAQFNLRIHDLDICPRGICGEWFLTGSQLGTLEDLLQVDGGLARRVNIFPRGFPKPELFHTQVTYDFDGIPRGL